MISVVLAFIVGLVVGWNVIPQPTWAKNLYNRWFYTEY